MVQRFRAFAPGLATVFFFSDGTLNRKALGSVIFSDVQARHDLDALMQPLLRKLIDQRIEQAHQSGAPLCVLDMPLLYEAGLEDRCDRVWCAWIPRELQLERLMARDHLTLQEAQARLDSQLPAEEKANRADIVIDTSGSIGYTKSMLPELYARELQA